MLSPYSNELAEELGLKTGAVQKLQCMNFTAASFMGALDAIPTDMVKHTPDCYIRQEPFTEQDYKVRDHDHATGEYREAAHRSCNLRKKRKIVIPVFIHNLRDYDSHLIMRGIHEYAEERKINVIFSSVQDYTQRKRLHCPYSRAK